MAKPALAVAAPPVAARPADVRRRPARPGRVEGARRALVTAVTVGALWELVGRLKLVGDGAFPALSAIATRWWQDRADYPPHIAATVRAASLGFAFGVAIAVLAGVAFATWPTLERLMRGVGITLFAVPLIALVPVLILAFSGTKPRVILAALAVYYPTMISTVIGLREIDPRLPDVIRVSGGDDRAVMRYVRLRSAVPSVLAGMRMAAPAALLGAILAEFGGGVRWGLGSYLLASLGQARPARLWGIGLVATAIAASAYGIFSWLGARVTRANLSATLATNATPAVLESGPKRPLWQRAAFSIASVLVVLGLWAGVLRLLHMSPVVAKSPLGVVRYLATGARGANARHRLLTALRQTLPLGFLGLVAGLAAAFVLAVTFKLRPSLGRAVFPFALVTQTMPLAALTPLVVLVFGRDVLATTVVCLSVTFFPSFVIISQALSATSPKADDVIRAYGGSPWASMRFVGLPAAVPALLTAARLATPRALLGVMIAEYLATGNGLGFLLSQSRGLLDYGMIWTVAATSVTVAIILTQFVGLLERRVTRVAGNGTS
ncbi:MAG TPA: ABC transporter permease subunit [Acidimicrobiales bacterium]|nr:ABC transporter permease subunit [Acidimicrobiales bacterium]